MVCRKFWWVSKHLILACALCKSDSVLYTIFFHLAYAISKYGVTLSVMGMSEEFRCDGVAVNALWPRTGKNDWNI